MEKQTDKELEKIEREISKWFEEQNLGLSIITINDLLLEHKEAVKKQSRQGMIKIEDVNKMIDESIKKISKLRQNITSRDMLKPTMKNMQKYHVFEVTEFERLKQSIQKLNNQTDNNSEESEKLPSKSDGSPKDKTNNYADCWFYTGEPRVK